MDDLEFRRKAIIDPQDQSQIFLQKARQSKENLHFVEDQLDFQYTLTKTLQIDVPENLSNRIILNRRLSEHKKNRQHQHLYRYTAGFAATLALVLAAMLFLPKNDNPQQLTYQIINHLYEDTHALNVKMDVPKNSIDTILASYGGKLSSPIGHVTFLGHCIIGKNTGIHLVLQASQGFVTVIILPTETLQYEQPIADNQYKGIIYPGHKGSIAIIAESLEPVTDVRERIDHSLKWLI